MSKITLTADQVIGKRLYAKRKYKTRSYPNSPDFQEYDPGFVGVVYSWVQNGLDVWWAFEYTNGEIYYVKHEPGLFSQENLISQFTPEEQAAIAEQSKIDLPNWLTFGAAAFGFYQSFQPENAKYKALYLLGAFGAAAYGATKVISKVDFNPFDDLLGSGN